jgi:hypothetical protein
VVVVAGTAEVFCFLLGDILLYGVGASRMDKSLRVHGMLFLGGGTLTTNQDVIRQSLAPESPLCTRSHSVEAVPARDTWCVLCAFCHAPRWSQPTTWLHRSGVVTCCVCARRCRFCRVPVRKEQRSTIVHCSVCDVLCHQHCAPRLMSVPCFEGVEWLPRFLDECDGGAASAVAAPGVSKAAGGRGDRVAAIATAQPFYSPIGRPSPPPLPPPPPPPPPPPRAGDDDDRGVFAATPRRASLQPVLPTELIRRGSPLTDVEPALLGLFVEGGWFVLQPPPDEYTDWVRDLTACLEDCADPRVDQHWSFAKTSVKDAAPLSPPKHGALRVLLRVVAMRLTCGAHRRGRCVQRTERRPRRLPRARPRVCLVSAA